MSMLITAPRMLLGTRLVSPGWVACADGIIVGAGQGRPSGKVTLALADGVLSPGLVDAQCNGAFGHDLSTAGVDGWLAVIDRLPSTGVTAFVPTLVTDHVDAMTVATERFREVRDHHGGARILGLHYEGPFLSPHRYGAHPVEHLATPDGALFTRLRETAGDALLYMTLAPEIPGGLDAIQHLVADGVRVAIGHSDATDIQTIAAIDAGATLITHLYNAQRPFAHRDPGVTGVGLSDPRVTVGLIVDLHHVAPTAVRVAFAAAAGRVMLVTDAVAAMGVEPGRWTLAGREVEIRPGEPPRLADGTIAGSTLRLDTAVANAIGLGVDPATALAAATRVPADALGFAQLGRIEVGAAADLVWLGDNWQARATWINGVPSPSAPAADLAGL